MSTTRFVVDAWAWIEYVRGTARGQKVKDQIAIGAELWTSVLTLAEVVSKYRRSGLVETNALNAISALSKLAAPDRGDAIEVGALHAEVRRNSPNFSLVDSFVLHLARKVGAKVLTGDPDFKGLKDAVILQ